MVREYSKKKGFIRLRITREYINAEKKKIGGGRKEGEGGSMA